MAKSSTGATLVIPENVPADVLQQTQHFLDAVSRADLDGGGIEQFGLYVTTTRNYVEMFGQGSQHVQAGIIRVLSQDVLRRGGPCRCPNCLPVNSASSDAAMTRFEQLLKASRPTPPEPPQDQQSEARPSWFSRFLRGRK